MKKPAHRVDQVPSDHIRQLNNAAVYSMCQGNCKQAVGKIVEALRLVRSINETAWQTKREKNNENCEPETGEADLKAPLLESVTTRYRSQVSITASNEETSSSTPSLQQEARAVEPMNTARMIEAYDAVFSKAIVLSPDMASAESSTNSEIAVCPTSQELAMFSVVLLYNLGLAFQLQGIAFFDADTSYNHLASMRNQRGILARSAAIYELARNILMDRELSSLSPRCAVTLIAVLYNLGSIHFALGKQAKAQLCFESFLHTVLRLQLGKGLVSPPAQKVAFNR